MEPSDAPEAKKQRERVDAIRTSLRENACDAATLAALTAKVAELQSAVVNAANAKTTANATLATGIVQLSLMSGRHRRSNARFSVVTMTELPPPQNA
jgi:hypothetical protein